MFTLQLADRGAKPPLSRRRRSIRPISTAHPPDALPGGRSRPPRSLPLLVPITYYDRRGKVIERELYDRDDVSAWIRIYNRSAPDHGEIVLMDPPSGRPFSQRTIKAVLASFGLDSSR